MDEWVSTEPKVWKAEEAGDCIMGQVVQKKEKGGKYENESFLIEGNEAIYVVFGTAVLEDRMRAVEIGDRIKIVYKGVEKNKRNEDTKIFEVFKKKISSKKAEEVEREILPFVQGQATSR